MPNKIIRRSASEHQPHLAPASSLHHRLQSQMEKWGSQASVDRKGEIKPAAISTQATGNPIGEFCRSLEVLLQLYLLSTLLSLSKDMSVYPNLSPLPTSA